MLSKVSVPSVWFRRIECINIVSDDEFAYDLFCTSSSSVSAAIAVVPMCVCAGTGRLATYMLFCIGHSNAKHDHGMPLAGRYSVITTEVPAYLTPQLWSRTYTHALIVAYENEDTGDHSPQYVTHPQQNCNSVFHPSISVTKYIVSQCRVGTEREKVASIGSIGILPRHTPNRAASTRGNSYVCCILLTIFGRGTSILRL